MESAAYENWVPTQKVRENIMPNCIKQNITDQLNIYCTYFPYGRQLSFKQVKLITALRRYAFWEHPSAYAPHTCMEFDRIVTVLFPLCMQPEICGDQLHLLQL